MSLWIRYINIRNTVYDRFSASQRFSTAIKLESIGKEIRSTTSKLIGRVSEAMELDFFTLESKRDRCLIRISVARVETITSTVIKMLKTEICKVSTSEEIKLVLMRIQIQCSFDDIHGSTDKVYTFFSWQINIRISLHRSNFSLIIAIRKKLRNVKFMNKYDGWFSPQKLYHLSVFSPVILSNYFALR